jgi:hypothetical protein
MKNEDARQLNRSTITVLIHPFQSIRAAKRHPMGKSAESTTSIESISSSFANSLEHIQRMFRFLHNDFCLCLLAGHEDIDDGENSTICTHDDTSLLNSIYPNYASWSVRSHDFHGKVMAPFDLSPEEVCHVEHGVMMMKAKKKKGRASTIHKSRCLRAA